MAELLTYHLVDVFTGTAFAGNPLAVVLDADDLRTAQCQALAAEFNLSETVFPLPPSTADADYRVRIFTPRSELPFAGHPSVGAAWLLVHLGRLAPGAVTQECGVGLVSLDIEPGPGWVRLHGVPPTVSGPLDPVPLLAAVGLSDVDLAGPPPRSAGAGLTFGYLAVDPGALARAAPDLVRLRALPGIQGGVSVFTVDAGEVQARVFHGDIGEDPATGSAALGLGAWLVASGLAGADGQTGYTITQGVQMGRPSRLECTVTAEHGRPVAATVAGHVMPVAQGTITRPPAR